MHYNLQTDGDKIPKTWQQYYLTK